MKKIIIIISALTVSFSNAQNLVSSDSKTIKATLFLSGAQVYRQAKVNLNKGANLVKLTGLRQNINANSIIVDGSNDFTIVSVEMKANYIRAAQDLSEYSQLSKEIEKLNWDLRKLRADKSILDEEYSVLMTNIEVKGKDETMNVEKLMDYSETYYEKLVDLSIKHNDLSKKETEMTDRLNKMRMQINDLEKVNNKYTSEIWVMLNANNASVKSITFNYYTNEAYWKPFYDIRTNDGDDKVNFVLKGKLLQYTGETWEKINLTLSTGNPSLTSSLPTLSPWTVYAVKPYKHKGGGGKKRAMSSAYGGFDDAPSAISKNETLETDEKVSLKESYVQPLATAQNNITTLEYKINEPYTLEGDNRFYDVDVISNETKGNKSYYSAPRYEEKAYMLTSLPEWGKLNLLSGDAAMYFNDNYVGKIMLNTEGVEDTLDLSFGPDNNVLISRRCIHSKDRAQIAGSNRVVNRTIEIAIRNNKQTAVELDVDDQMPIAYNKSISIEKMDLAGAKYDEKTGYLSWKVKLAPGESKKIIFSYRVKYPKSSAISSF